MTPSHPTEKKFEDHIEAHLLSSGYRKGQSADYDRELCLIPAEVIAFIAATQPTEYEKLQKQYGDATDDNLCRRLAKEIGKRGSLDVLRKGIKDRGCAFRLSYFKPVSGMNPEHLALYRQNRFTVTRQLFYSTRNNNSIDVAFFLNGLPLITCELKNSLTGQFVEEAIKQYRHDRDPKEALFKFKRCLVHFAVGNEKVAMTTRLAGDKTRFLPFNKDTENPLNPHGFRTHYLWEDILQPDTLLDLLENYLHVQINSEKVYGKSGRLEEKRSEALIFPRYHQFDVVRNLLAKVKNEGEGHSYLIQHSAGSGKSNSIAWLAHQLASLYRNEYDQQRLFDSIIVVTDRRVLDKQLQDTVKQFEQTTGVVVPITTDSAALRDAIEAKKDIIITTLQKFGVISKTTSAHPGLRYAVIIDEAHSSQSGESAKHLNQTLNADLEHAEECDSVADEATLEDKILEEIRLRSKQQKHISYFAFTATPKNKTLELFGRKNFDGKPVAFHVYSMRQAIEEKFILDVLENYTTFKRYFKLTKTAASDAEFEKKKAIRLLTSYVDLQPHAIETKSRLMLDHFIDHTINAIEGRGRAMVVTRSRLHAVKYYLMFRKVMMELNLPCKPLVAFSGDVIDPDTDARYTENGLNALPPKVGIPDALKTPEFRILIAANKFQTGFDEPLLHTMYVDKKLGGVGAVQTLSRLNRTMHGKDGCVVIDYVNEADDILASFQDYYQTTLLEDTTDPNKLYDLQQQIIEFELFLDEDVDAFAAIFFDPQQPQEQLQPLLDTARGLWRQREVDEREEFRGRLNQFSRLYGFLSQILTFEDVELEKFYVFCRLLARKLDRREGILPLEVLDAVDLDSFRIQKTYEGTIDLRPEDRELSTIGEGQSGFNEEETDLLSSIIKTLNETHGLNLSEDDKVDMQSLKDKIYQRDDLRSAFQANNPASIRKMKFEEVLDDILLEFVHTKLDLYKKLNQPSVNRNLKDMWYSEYQKGREIAREVHIS
ncbi:MAG: type I restriction endonuclease subunit R [Desulfuromonadales bacterium]|nr:type I restriction endonuclease subunit R [Desulfuromonadales bacterium]